MNNLNTEQACWQVELDQFQIKTEEPAEECRRCTGCLCWTEMHVEVAAAFLYPRSLLLLASSTQGGKGKGKFL